MRLMRKETSPLDSSSWQQFERSTILCLYCSNCVLATGGLVCVLKHTPWSLPLSSPCRAAKWSLTNQAGWWHRSCSRVNGSSKESNTKRLNKNFKVAARDQAKEVRQSQVSTEGPGNSKGSLDPRQLCVVRCSESLAFHLLIASCWHHPLERDPFP